MFKIFNTFILITFLMLGSAFSEILKPNETIVPEKVIKIQLDGLKKNDSGYKDQGIEQTWEFAHPTNKIFTGPLDRFKEMIKGDSYNMLINHISHEVLEIYIEDERALYEVTVLDSDKKYYKFRWQVEKFLDKGPLKNCWLTTVVSQPIPLGSST